MRPAHVFARPAHDDRLHLLCLLRGRWRFTARLVMVLMSLSGYPAESIAELFGYSPQTVRRWLYRYNQQGAQGLRDRPRSGRPRLGSPRIGERIGRLLAQPRAWTVNRLWIRLRPAMSLRTLKRRVGEVANWRRPRLVAKGDPQQATRLAALQGQIAQLPQGSVLLAEDESHLNLLPHLRSTWILKRQRQLLVTPGQNQRRSVFGALEMASGRWFYRVTRKATSASFIEFLEQLVAAYPGAPIVAIVLDNVITHRSQTVQRWLLSHSQVNLIYGARYCPHHNPVERIWGALKAYLANSPTRTMTGRLCQLHAFFGARTPSQMLKTASPFNSPWFPDSYAQNFREAALQPPPRQAHNLTDLKPLRLPIRRHRLHAAILMCEGSVGQARGCMGRGLPISLLEVGCGWAIGGRVAALEGSTWTTGSQRPKMPVARSSTGFGRR